MVQKYHITVAKFLLITFTQKDIEWCVLAKFHSKDEHNHTREGSNNEPQRNVFQNFNRTGCLSALGYYKHIHVSVSHNRVKQKQPTCPLMSDMTSREKTSLAEETLNKQNEHQAVYTHRKNCQ